MTDDVEVLRQTIRTLQDNNKLRWAEIQMLNKRIAALKARITELQRIAERKNKERNND
jgi:uncharacterized small protein (DUF1192 family)